MLPLDKKILFPSFLLVFLFGWFYVVFVLEIFGQNEDLD